MRANPSVRGEKFYPEGHLWSLGCVFADSVLFA